MEHRTKADLEREMLAKAERFVPPPLKVPFTPWTNREVADLKRMYFEGNKTFQEIGQRLGRSRNAISGALNRLRQRGEL